MHSSEVKNRLLGTIDKVIGNGQWETSLFFRNILKRLLGLRASIIDQLGEDAEDASSSSQSELSAIEHKEGYQRIYVAIYQADGTHLNRWINVIKSLCERCMSRPVYSTEEEVAEMIRAKGSRSDAYIVAWIRPTDIVASYNGIVLKDRFGHELLTLKDGSIKLDNITEFVHEKKRYCFNSDRLVLRS